VPKQPLFRREAIEHHAQGGAKAELLRIAPDSTAGVLHLLCAAMVLAVVFGSFGRLNEYASGPAVVRMDGRTSITASSAALVSEVLVVPGRAVKEGDVLARLYATEEAAELEAASREFDEQLLKLLHHPEDGVAREALVSLRTRRELARARLDQRTLRAPHRGVVSDVRVRAGQLVEPGMSVVELEGEHATATVVALLPGRYRALLKKGAVLRFDLDGFQQRAQELPITDIGDQIVGPTEAARYIGRELADAFQITGPVVIVHAALPNATFRADAERFRFAHGMHGKAETIVRNEPIAYAFVPGLKQWVQQ
jgi:multidrug efflux pump subunit AcrA (membrane-fusion protein)